MATFQRNVRILVAVPLLLPHQFGDQRWEMVYLCAGRWQLRLVSFGIISRISNK
jgi:hypothetical protein